MHTWFDIQQKVCSSPVLSTPTHSFLHNSFSLGGFFIQTHPHTLRHFSYISLLSAHTSLCALICKWFCRFGCGYEFCGGVCHSGHPLRWNYSACPKQSFAEQKVPDVARLLMFPQFDCQKKKKVVNCWAAPSPRRSFMDPLCKYNTLTTLYENVYFHLRTITLCCILCYYNLSKLLPLNDPQKPQVIFPRAFCNPVTSYMCPHSHVPTYSHRDPSRTISFHARLTSSFVYLSTPSKKWNLTSHSVCYLHIYIEKYIQKSDRTYSNTRGPPISRKQQKNKRHRYGCVMGFRVNKNFTVQNNFML